MEVILNTALMIWGWLLEHLLYINLVFSIIIIFFQRRDPRSVWTWLLALYFIPVFGIIFYLLFGQDLKKSRIIAAAIGDSKVEAIKAALKSGKIDILVTDLDTAKQI